MIQMSRMGLSSRNFDRLHVISHSRHNGTTKRSSHDGHKVVTRVVGDTTLRTLGAGAGVGGGNADAGANPEDRATPVNPAGEDFPR